MQHHANLLIGPPEWALSQIPKEHTEEGQDVRFMRFENMTIGDARNLIKEANLRPVEKENRIFVIMTHTILREAQNALLKLFEDPNECSLFYLIVPQENVLLPTLRSRMHLMSVNTEDPDIKAFSELLKAPYAKRLALIDEKLKTEDTKWIKQITAGLEVHAETEKDHKLIKDVLMLRQYINTKGSSKKMLLEHIALSL